MAYTISSAFAIYFVLWWIVLFVTLPFGVRSQSEDGAAIPGSEPGAPIAPLLLRKVLWSAIYAGFGAAATLGARVLASRIWRLATGEEPPVPK